MNDAAAMTATHGGDDESHRLWTRLRCSRCRYATEHPGTPTLADLDRDCALCRSPLGAVTIYAITPRPR